MDFEEERLYLFTDTLLTTMEACYPLVSPIAWLKALAASNGYNEKSFICILNGLLEAGFVQSVAVDGEVSAVVPTNREHAKVKLSKSRMH